MSTKCWRLHTLRLGKGCLTRVCDVRASNMMPTLYVRLRIIAIHCDFSSESYIHIDPKYIFAL